METVIVPSDSLSPRLSPVSPLREVWAIAWPTVLTMTSYTVMQWFDKLMVGQVSPTALAAQSNGGLWSFTMLSFALGVLTVVNTYVSQNLGAGTPREGSKYAWASIWLGIIVWLVMMVPIGFALPTLFTHMPGHSPELVRLEVAYAQIMMFTSVFVLLGRGINQYFFGMHLPLIITLAAIVGNVVDLILNWILIFGDKGIPAWGIPGVPGMPALGLHGAAYSTAIGMVIELAIPMAIFLGPKMAAKYGTREEWRPRWKAMRDLLKIGWPAGMQWGNELVCWAIFMTLLVGQFGSDHMAASAIAMGYMHLSFMPAVGLSTATTSLVGKYIGAGKPDIANARALLCVKVAMVYMTICGALFVIFSRPLISMFISADVPPDEASRIIDVGIKVLICCAFFQTADSLGMVFSGALRGAGDTVWPGVITVVYAWVFIVAGGWAMTALFPGLESMGPWIASSFYIILFGVTMWLRFRSGRWRSIKLVDGAKASAAESAPMLGTPPDSRADTCIDDMAAGITQSREPVETIQR